jgi:hypothetical protein
MLAIVVPPPPQEDPPPPNPYTRHMCSITLPALSPGRGGKRGREAATKLHWPLTLSTDHALTCPQVTMDHSLGAPTMDACAATRQV